MTNLRPEVELRYYCAREDIIVTKVAENGVARRNWPRLYRETGVMNLNVTSYFKAEVVIWSKLRMRSKTAKTVEKQRRAAKISNVCY